MLLGFAVLAFFNVYGCPNEPLYIDSGMWLQLSVSQLRVHTISQFLKLGIREPIRFRLVVQRNLERVGHALHDRRLHEHPRSIRGKELVVRGYRPLVRAHL